jgi:hypothetical protein
MLKPLLGSRIVMGPADSAELRLLMAHANMMYATMPDLAPAGVQAAHSTLIELAKAVARTCFDDVEPLLAPRSPRPPRTWRTADSPTLNFPRRCWRGNSTAGPPPSTRGQPLIERSKSIRCPKEPSARAVSAGVAGTDRAGPDGASHGASASAGPGAPTAP